MSDVSVSDPRLGPDPVIEPIPWSVYRIPLIHRICGELCYLSDVLPSVFGSIIENKHLTTPDGRRCRPDEVEWCPRCGPIGPRELTW